MLNSCSTEFNPNGEWEETIVVYGVLDTDNDTTVLRIQKCYLGEGNLLHYAKITDSNLYEDGDLDVRIKEYSYSQKGSSIQKGEPTGNEFNLNRMIVPNKQEGEFFGGDLPIYFAETKGKLFSDKLYVLEVRNIKTGKIFNAETIPIKEGIELKHNPRHNIGFLFEKKVNNERYAEIKWTTNASAVTYQPVFRFYFIEKNSMLLKYRDYKGPVIRSEKSGTDLNYDLSETAFGNYIKNELNLNYSDNSLIFYDSISIFITAADVYLSDYMELNANKQGLLQEKPIYTNVQGGVGVFGARTLQNKKNYKLNNQVLTYINSLGNWFY